MSELGKRIVDFSQGDEDLLLKVRLRLIKSGLSGTPVGLVAPAIQYWNGDAGPQGKESRRD
jgi:hypothetical protein